MRTYRGVIIPCRHLKDGGTSHLVLLNGGHIVGLEEVWGLQVPYHTDCHCGINISRQTGGSQVMSSNGQLFNNTLKKN